MKQTREQLEHETLAYVEGQLSPADAARFEVYLANTDPALAAQVAGMIADRENLAAAPRLRAPRDMAERIMEQVERTSLIGDVEKNLGLEPRRWWNHHMAVAAGLLIVVGLFGFFIVHSVWRPINPWQNPVAKGGGGLPPPDGTRLAMGPAGGGFGGAPIAPDHGFKEPKDVAKDAVVMGKGGSGGGGGNLVMPTPVSAPTAGADQEIQAAQTLTIATEEAVGKITAHDANFNGAPNSQIALTNVGVNSRANAGNSPVIVVLQARDDADYQRLRSLIAYFLETDPATAQQQVALVNYLNTYNFNNNNDDANRNGGGAPNPGVQPNDNFKYDQQRSVAANQAANPQRDANRDQLATPRNAEQFNPQYQVGGPVQVLAANASGAAGENLRRQMASQPAETKRGLSNANSIAFLGDNAAPYRVVLRADQLDQVTTQFAVHSITRGNTGYLIRSGALTTNNTLNYAIVNGAGNVFAVNGALNGSFANGAGGNAFTQSGANNYSGATTLGGIGNPTPTGAGSLTIGAGSVGGAGGTMLDRNANPLNGTTLALNGGNTTPNLSSAGAISGANSFAGGTSVTAGTLKVSPASPPANPAPTSDFAQAGPGRAAPSPAAPAPAVAVTPPATSAAAPPVAAKASLRENAKGGAIGQQLLPDTAGKKSDETLDQQQAMSIAQQPTKAINPAERPPLNSEFATPQRSHAEQTEAKQTEAARNAGENTRNSGPWVDCIITMVRGDIVPLAPAAPNKNTQSK